MDESIKKMLKDAVSITDQDLEKLSPRMQNFLSNAMDFLGHKIVAEVTESKYCFQQLKPGDKFVIQGGRLMPEASTANLCLSALGPLVETEHIIFDRIGTGVFPEPGEVIAMVKCPDNGIDHDGLGEVWFKVYTEPA